MKFIEVTETHYGDRTLINIEQISHIFVGSNCIVMGGNHGFDGGGGWGLLKVSEDDMKKVLAAIIELKKEEI